MRLLPLMLFMCLSIFARAEESSPEILEAARNSIFKSAVGYFNEAKYQSAIDELNSITYTKNITDQKTLGFISYWKGICFNRLQNFPESMASFQAALAASYSPIDIHYEYGQALFAAEKLAEARLQFRESLRKKFKRAVSLYYIAFITSEMGDRLKAHAFYSRLKKLPPEEAEEVRQAVELQIGDIYLEQAEKRPDAFRSVEAVVIPQYQKALELDPYSPLASLIQEKITTLQRKYELVLFQLRNGRPALVPPYLLRFAQEFGLDSNVTFSPAGTTISKSKQQSTYSKTDFLGRYTYYIQNYLSLAPEFRFNNTYYFNRVPEIYRNDNYLLAPALRTAYEHRLFKKPASFLVDYDYNEARRDVNARKRLEFNSRSHTFMIGERFNFFSGGESIIRLRRRTLQSYAPSSNSTSTSLVFEQIKSLRTNILLLYFSYDRMRVVNNIFDTNSFTFRGDLILSRIGDWFTPTLALSLTSTDPINNPDRGQELLLNPSLRLSKSFKKSWRANLKFDYQKYYSKDVNNFAYQKMTTAFELEYLF